MRTTFQNMNELKKKIGQVVATIKMNADMQFRLTFVVGAQGLQL